MTIQLSDDVVDRYLRLAGDYWVEAYPLRAIVVYKLLLRADPGLFDRVRERLTWSYQEIDLPFDERSLTEQTDSDRSRWEALRALEELEQAGEVTTRCFSRGAEPRPLIDRCARA